MAKRQKVAYDTRVTITIKGEKVTAPVHLLNLFSIYAGECGLKFADDGCFCLSKKAGEVHREIYDQLNALGLFG